jgi:hypothetical protein
MRKLVLHAGTHKTGTSAIQQVLHQYRSALLRESGVFYPDPVPWFGESFVAHHVVAHSIATGEGLQKVEDFLSSLSQQAITDRVVTLLSSEAFYRQRLVGVNDHTKGRQMYLDRLADYLSPFDVRVLLLLRRRDAFAESMYHERVSKGYSKSFRAFLTEAAPLLDYRQQVDAFAQSFNTVQTVDYEELRRTGLVKGFLKTIGAVVPSDSEVPWVRRSPDARLSLWMAKRNGEESSDESIALRRRFCRNPNTQKLFEDYGEVTIWPSSADRRGLLEAFGDTGSQRKLPGPTKPAVLTAEDEARIDEAYTDYAASRARTQQGRPRRAAAARAEPDRSHAY